MTPVYLDTVGLLALWDRSDQWHDVAEAAFKDLALVGTPLTTSIFVLAECGNAAARRPYRLAVDRLRDQLEVVGRLIRLDDGDWDAAWEAYRRGEAGQAGIVDHLSFVSMRRFGLRRAFTNDAHFRAAGFETLF